MHLIISSFFLLLGCDGAASSPAPTPEPSATPMPEADVSDCLTLPTAASGPYQAHYIGAEGKTNLILHRLDERRCALEYPNAAVIEIIQRLGEKDILLEKRFVDRKRSILYNRADLRDVQRGTDFEALCSWLPAGQRATSGRAETYRCLSITAHHGSKIVSGWIDSHNLPAWTHGTGDEAARALRLDRFVGETPLGDWIAERSAYQPLDYADIGDNEADPFVREVIEQGLIEHQDHEH